MHEALKLQTKTFIFFPIHNLMDEYAGVLKPTKFLSVNK